MYPAFSLVLFFLPLASALSNLVISSNPTSGGSVTITWSGDSTDPATFSMVLANSNFHNTFAIGNNIQTSAGTLTVTLPIVPADQYTLEAVQVNNINSVIGTSAPFAIGATVTTTSSGSASSTLSSSGSVSNPTGSSTTGSTSLPVGSVTSSSSSSSSSSSASASSFNGNGNGALGTHIDSGKVGSIAVAVVGIVAGAVFV
ncbi:hypothetical protein DFH94DRAFT_438382 [Russula ochroleuca]|uniref:Yeast cell wall synthesis Kre9/Knh1-like N-terminal domain-containing protein n=1 Tax=Russula ochroleuca TaxID=152965 RepID=A0A9P5TA46_9AGAM|nr:hypothetical protein DFH94DRAFT_438382 [Russula ochroleuca]